MDQSEIRRLAADYGALTDQQLWAVIDSRGELGEEAATAAAAVLAQRSGAAAAPSDAAVRCDCCGGADEVEEHPFVVARDKGYTFASLAAAFFDSSTTSSQVRNRTGRHLADPQLLTLRICAECRMRMSRSEMLGGRRLLAEAYTHHPEYAALEREGYDVVIDRHDMPTYGFSAPVTRLT